MRGGRGACAGMVGHAFSATDSLEPVVEEDYDDYEVLQARRRARARAAEARDADGRRRFHGAFTGGFAAGFHNTCGSAEGWAPREYRSTRGARVAVPQTTLDDVMDDEDKAVCVLLFPFLSFVLTFHVTRDTTSHHKCAPTHRQ